MKARVIFDPPFTQDVFPLVPGRNLLTGIPELSKALGPLTSLEEDLMTLASAIYALDLATKRNEREDFTRDIGVVIPVVNYHAFERVKSQIVDILYILSDDNWEIEFSRRSGSSEATTEWPECKGRTLLFSGGLDSLAAAVDLLEAGTQLQLASHYTRNRTILAGQENLFDYLQSVFGSQVSRVAARVTGQKSRELDFPADAERESSQRTRSFMFLVIAGIAARRNGFHEVVMIAENGQMAIHLPLTAARVGAFSTHTAHPEFVNEMERLLSTLLSFQIQITNPYLYKTKAECIANLAARHAPVISRSVSCWKSSRQSYSHCGECVPCMVRRIAIEYHGLKADGYERDLFNENIGLLSEDDTGKRNFNELAEFVTWFGGAYPDAKLEETFPELINEYIDKDLAIAMYRRFALEARMVLSQYSGARSVLV